MAARILTLDEIDGEPVGGKAAGLGRLRAMGLRIPETLVLIGAKQSDLPADLDARVAELGPGKWAVRSSARGEDGEEASFAGQYETVLDVEGPAALRAAIATCLDSSESDRASSYRAARDPEGDENSAVMSIVIQRMVPARASGVCFTVDPVTHRRNRLVIDSVAGLGEALVAGHVSADHDELQRNFFRWEPRQLAGDSPVLWEDDLERLAEEACHAESRAGEPLDLEWAIDQGGELYWLQARPITTLGLDPQALDAGLSDPSDVFTRCNVGEMMPGAVSPLTFSTCAQGIDIGWQMIQMRAGTRKERSPDTVYIAMSHGHLFINLSEGARFSSAVMGSDPGRQSLAICGRLVPEVLAPDPPSIWIRLPRMARQLYDVLRAQPKIRRMEAIVARGRIEPGATALESWQRIDAEMEGLYECYAKHLTVSSGAGALAPIVLSILAGDEEPTDTHHAVVSRLFAGAQNVESADIAEGAETIVEALVKEPTRPTGFVELEVADAVAWLESKAAGATGAIYTAYLNRHGHRSLRELDIRQSEWRHDPSPIVKSLQTQLRGRLRAGGKRPEPTATHGGGADENAIAESLHRLRWLKKMAHPAVRNRERGKSLLVARTADFKEAYRRLGEQLVAEERLPDADAIYFLLHEEIRELASAEASDALAEVAVARRDALAYQETLVFPEVAVGPPEPERPPAPTGDPNRIVGKPVSRGCVEGRARVVRTLEEAEALEPGEILVAPITDVGWTPYFSIIQGLVTDVGSAVSHGAVVAREYGLPAVLNTRIGTQALSTGDLIRLDGDRGIVERLESGARIENALRAIDAVNQADPNDVDFEGQSWPRSLLDSQRATQWLSRLTGEPAETLSLAVRAHHLGRWKHPRAEFPEGRAGYHSWRRELQNRHAADAAEILKDAGYSVEETDRVGTLIRKRGLGSDPEVQLFEDVLCLVFVETALAQFASRHPDEKVVSIIEKTLAKMSDEGRDALRQIDLDSRTASLVSLAAADFAKSS